MTANHFSEGDSPRQVMRGVVDLCADCDTCRSLMERECLFFPELYRLADREKEQGVAATGTELRALTTLCTLCGMCPCPNVRGDIIKSKSRYVEEEGVPLSVRLLVDVPRAARVCGAFPRLSRGVRKKGLLGLLLRKLIGLHPERHLPEIPPVSFFDWAAQKGVTSKREGARKVAYFAGCTAGYLFPEVGKATVEVLERHGVTVYVPPQQCCGMPHMLEGDREGALQRSRFNLDSLLLALQEGYDLVCSCPSCGYLMKVLLRERAYHSEAYQRSVDAGEDEIVAPNPGHPENKFLSLRKSVYRHILKDDGYFSPLPPLQRIKLAESISDAGEYLERIVAEKGFAIGPAAEGERMLYYAPCHQREQQMGRPYLGLLEKIPGLTIEDISGENCCGMGGNLGFKADFHDKSLAVGEPLLSRIRDLAPQAIVTDCLSCRMQFRHALPYPVFHPMELLARACQGEDRDPFPL